ncbi:hypothetical protein L9F63_008469, partial [Diploptera punctata]
NAAHLVRLATEILFQNSHGYVRGEDEYSVVENIKKKLALTQGEKNALTFIGLHQKLQQRKPLKNRQAILQFLYSISDTSDIDIQMSRSSSSQFMSDIVASEANSVENIHRSYFALPTLSSSVSLAESTPGLASHLSSSSSDQSWHQDRHGTDHESRTHRYHQTSSCNLSAESTKLSEISHTSEVSESQLLQDLIFTFQGIDGKILKFSPVSQGYKLDPQ